MNLNRLINNLNSTLSRTTSINIAYDIVKQYNGIDWTKYASKHNSFDKKLLYYTDTYEMFLFSWPKGYSGNYYSHPHDGYIVKLMSGKLYRTNIKQNIINELNKSDIIICDSNNVFHINSPIKSHSLHIYSKRVGQFQFTREGIGRF